MRGTIWVLGWVPVLSSARAVCSASQKRSTGPLRPLEKRRARASDRTGLADRGGGGGGSHAASAPAPLLRCSLPVVLSVFDGERTLGQAIRLLSRSLQPFGIDIVVWLLRRKILMLSDCD